MSVVSNCSGLSVFIRSSWFIHLPNRNCANVKGISWSDVPFIILYFMLSIVDGGATTYPLLLRISIPTPPIFERV